MGGRRVGSDASPPDRLVNEGLIHSLVVDLGLDHVGALIDLFGDDAPARIAALRAATEAGDAHGAARVAHAMKSAGGAVGAVAYAARCGRIEQLAASGRLDLAGTDVDHLPADLAAATAALASAAASAPAAGAGLRGPNAVDGDGLPGPNAVDGSVTPPATAPAGER